jgi:hypothetical protein
MFLLNTLTVPKIKDLVNKPNQQYKDIFDTLNASASGADRAGASASGADRAGRADRANTKAVITSVKNNNIDPVADELSSFLNDLKKNTTQKKSSNDFESYTNDNIVASSIVGGEISGGSSSNYSLY